MPDLGATAAAAARGPLYPPGSAACMAALRLADTLSGGGWRADTEEKPPYAILECSLMIEVKRLAHATFNTPDLDRIVDYWTRIIGLTVVERDSKRAFLATRYGEEAVAVQAGDNANLVKSAF